MIYNLNLFYLYLNVKFVEFIKVFILKKKKKKLKPAQFFLVTFKQNSKIYANITKKVVKVIALY